MTTATMPSHESVSSAENVLTLLIALREHGRLRVADAAELLSVTPPTAHRLLSTLKRHEFAEQDRKRVYLPGPRLARLPSGAEPPHDLGALAHPYLAALSRKVGTTTFLVTLQGNGCRFIDGVESNHALRVGSRIGLLLPAHTTSGGKVLLAQLPDTELVALYPNRHVRLRDGSMRDLVTLRRELGVVRRKGYALSLEETEQCVNAVGVPVTSRSGKVVAAVVLVCPSVSSSRRQLVDLVPDARATATAIAENLT
ncbi:IclR family transcriptional regulator [Nocardia sp. CA-119907]|uniref:IclR family transcriptional regulator n=1 Tax=Nocardia sp. CA-119907 TaxID=3239973 RepID=UPI003D96BFED